MRAEMRWMLGALALALIVFTARYVTADEAEAEPRALARWPAPDEFAELTNHLEPVSGSNGFVVPETRLAADERNFGDFDEWSPLSPPVESYAPPAAPRTWRVSAVLIAENRRVAIVNDSVVGVGDPLPGGARVALIQPDSVVLRLADGKRTVLRL